MIGCYQKENLGFTDMLTRKQRLTDAIRSEVSGATFDNESLLFTSVQFIKNFETLFEIGIDNLSK